MSEPRAVGPQFGWLSGVSCGGSTEAVSDVGPRSADKPKTSAANVNTTATAISRSDLRMRPARSSLWMVQILIVPHM